LPLWTLPSLKTLQWLDHIPILQQQWLEIMQVLTKFTTQYSINLWLAILFGNLIHTANFIQVSLADTWRHLMASLHLEKWYVMFWNKMSR
jgi:hypothetical protein